MRNLQLLDIVTLCDKIPIVRLLKWHCKI